MFGLFKKKDEGLWVLHKGIGNSDDALLRKGKSLGDAICQVSDSASDAFIKSVKEHDPELDTSKIENGVYLETMVLLIHLVDRISYSILGPEKRAVFVDAVVDQIVDVLSNSQPTDDLRMNFRGHFRSLLDKRQQDYASYRIPESSDEGTGGTLYWEASKVFAELCGKPNDIMTMMTAQTIIVGSLPILETKELLTN